MATQRNRDGRRRQEVIEEYKILNDHVLQFLDALSEFSEFDDAEFVSTYKDWCEAENINRPLSKAKLANATARHGIRRVRKKVAGERYFVWVNTAKS